MVDEEKSATSENPSEEGAIDLYRDPHHCFLKQKDVEICPAYESAKVSVCEASFHRREISLPTRYDTYAAGTPNFSDECKGCFTHRSYKALEEKIDIAKTKYDSKSGKRQVTEDELLEIKQSLGIN